MYSFGQPIVIHETGNDDFLEDKSGVESVTPHGVSVRMCDDGGVEGPFVLKPSIALTEKTQQVVGDTGLGYCIELGILGVFVVTSAF